ENHTALFEPICWNLQRSCFQFSLVKTGYLLLTRAWKRRCSKRENQITNIKRLRGEQLYRNCAMVKLFYPVPNAQCWRVSAHTASSELHQFDPGKIEHGTFFRKVA